MNAVAFTTNCHRINTHNIDFTMNLAYCMVLSSSFSHTSRLNRYVLLGCLPPGIWPSLGGGCAGLCRSTLTWSTLYIHYSMYILYILTASPPAINGGTPWNLWCTLGIPGLAMVAQNVLNGNAPAAGPLLCRRPGCQTGEPMARWIHPKLKVECQSWALTEAVRQVPSTKDW